MPTVADAERYTSYEPVSPTPSFQVGFSVFRDGNYDADADYAADLEVWLDGERQESGWSLSATFVDNVD